MSSAVEATCLTRYLYSTQVVWGRETEVIAEFTEMIASGYGVKKNLLQQEILKQTVSLKGYIKQ
eukprot:8308096-Ditylum_brightwellii.AAC.1